MSSTTRARAHAKRGHPCSCGVVAYGNGGNAKHQGMHARRGDGEHEITATTFRERFPQYGRCPVPGCMYRQWPKTTKEGGPCEEHATPRVPGGGRGTT
jgi:hypothetical protein